MAYTGTFCTVAEMQFKAGENVDATGNVEANHNFIAAEVESFINCLCRYNFNDNYSSLNADIKGVLKEAASNMSAIYLIQYNMAGYTSRVEAEDMINILWARFKQCIDVLRNQDTILYAKKANTRDPDATTGTEAYTYSHTADTAQSDYANQIIVGKLQTATYKTDITSITFKNGTSPAGNVNVAVYQAAGGGAKTGATLLGQGTATAQTGAGAYQTINLNSTVQLAAGTQFFLAISADGSFGYLRDTGAGTSGGYISAAGGVFTSVLGTVTDWYEGAIKADTTIYSSKSIFCTVEEIRFKAGENIDATGNTIANINQISREAEDYINCLCRYSFSDNYSSLNADVKGLLKEAVSNLAAIYLIQYNMSGYTSRVEAEDMINILWAKYKMCIELLKDQKTVTFMRGA